MTQPPHDPFSAFHRLRDAVRDRVPIPPADGLRSRAAARLRTRRLTTAGLAVAAVIALAGGGSVLVPPITDTSLPVRPGSPGTPTPTSTTPAPSPRPAPRPATPPDDPIATVDWSRATIAFPPEPGCPDGSVSFTPVSDTDPNGIGPSGAYPAIALDATRVAYGDLTGDGRLEAVLEAACFISEEGRSSGHGSQLVVVSRQEDGQLAALVRVGPPGAIFLSWWVADGRLLIEADPWVAAAEDQFVPVPGLALAYRWDGTGFGDWQPAAEYPPIMPPAGEPGPPVRPRAVAAALGCPDLPVRFQPAEPGTQGDTPVRRSTAAAGDASYALGHVAGSAQPYLFDLDRTGTRLLVTALRCTRADGTRTDGLAVLEPAGEGWRGISAVVSPGGEIPVSWRMEQDRLVVDWRAADEDRVVASTAYQWTGTVLAPVDR